METSSTQTRWRVFYGDGSTYASHETTWAELPEKGLVGVVIFTEAGRRELIQTCDWFWMDPAAQIHGVPTHAEWGQWAPKPDAPDEMVKQGEGLTDEQWTQIQDRMMAATWQ